MLGSSASTHHQCYSEAVQLLEFVHSESPQLGHDVEYIDLLVELKTRVRYSIDNRALYYLWV